MKCLTPKPHKSPMHYSVFVMIAILITAPFFPLADRNSLAGLGFIVTVVGGALLMSLTWSLRRPLSHILTHPSAINWWLTYYSYRIRRYAWSLLIGAGAVASGFAWGLGADYPVVALLLLLPIGLRWAITDDRP